MIQNIMSVLKKILVCVSAVLLASCAGEKKENAYVQKTFMLGVPAHIKVYGATKAQGKMIADAILNEWTRISDEFNYEDPYSITSLINRKGANEWVKADAEYLELLQVAIDYSRLTEGSFDITFAPLWPLWRDAAASKKLPAKSDINKALSMLGSENIEIDPAERAVHLKKPVEINLGGLLRGYCFERAYKLLEKASISYPVELRLGGNMLAYGGTGWEYQVTNTVTGKKMGRFIFAHGAVVSSSGREGFVEIEGQKYSHIIDTKTGYPIKDFSSLTVYFPEFGKENYLSSVALAVVGREKAFAAIEGMKGAAAIWIDGEGEPSYLINDKSRARWEEKKSFFEKLGLR